MHKSDTGKIINFQNYQSKTIKPASFNAICISEVLFGLQITQCVPKQSGFFEPNLLVANMNCTGVEFFFGGTTSKALSFFRTPNQLLFQKPYGFPCDGVSAKPQSHEIENDETTSSFGHTHLWRRFENLLIMKFPLVGRQIKCGEFPRQRVTD